MFCPSCFDNLKRFADDVFCLLMYPFHKCISSSVTFDPNTIELVKREHMCLVHAVPLIGACCAYILVGKTMEQIVRNVINIRIVCEIITPKTVDCV